MSDATSSTGGMATSKASSGVATNETDELIASNKVEGTAVYNRQGESLGTVYNFMVGKRSGKVEYAVMSFGGFLGIGESYHPIPWEKLTYDTRQGGYVVDIDESQLRDAPRYGAGEDPFSDPAYGRGVYGYYGLPYPGVAPYPMVGML